MQRILFKTHLPHAKQPTQGSEHAAGFDLYAAQIQVDTANQQLIIDTGLSVAFDTGHVLLLYGRSGLAAKQGIRLVNCTGVIDSDYRGPIKVLLRSDSLPFEEFATSINIGDRVAQAILMPIPATRWVERDFLPDTVRGEGGFGSSGAR